VIIRASLGGLVVASLLLIPVARRRWLGAIPQSRAARAVIPRLSSMSTRPVDDSLAAAEALVVDNDPFRLANHPASVSYDPRAGDGPQGAELGPLSVRPVFVLKAIVGGPPWQAVVEGFPGQAASVVVRTGERFDKLAVRSVTRDSVIVQAPDTTWVLTFRKR
jgi:hypothetical protein